MKTQIDLCAEQKIKGCRNFEQFSISTINIFFEEFPWLNKYISDRFSKSYYISNIEADILSYRPIKKNCLHCRLNKHSISNEEFMLIINNGDILIKVRHNKISDRADSIKKTIDETLFFLKSKPFSFQITHMLSYYICTNAAIVYKPPKGFTVDEWLNCLPVKEEKTTTQKEIDEIDKEGEENLKRKPSENKDIVEPNKPRLKRLSLQTRK